MHGTDWFYGHGLIMGGWLFMFLVWVLLVLGLVYAAKLLFGRRLPGNGDAALEIARRRYAAGEITEAEFERIKKNLGH